MTYRICTKCDIPHYDNCGSCFGFGGYPGENIPFIPIPAGEAHGIPCELLGPHVDWRDKWIPCPECKSTPKGLPIADTIRAELARQDMSQAELARKIGLKPQSLNRILMGHRSMGSEILERIMVVLGLQLR